MHYSFYRTPPIKCTVESCPNFFEIEKYNINSPRKFFDFPQNTELRALWQEACRIPLHHSTENLKICSDHFTDNDYDIICDSNVKPEDYHRRLKPDAVPHCNLDPELEQAVEENQLLKSQLEQLEKEKNELENKIAQVNLRMMKKVAATQRLKLRSERIRRDCNGSLKKNLLSKVFSHAQIGVLMGKRKVIWSDDDLAMAFTLRHMGNKECYLYLKETLNFPLPALSCIQKWAASLHET